MHQLATLRAGHTNYDKLVTMWPHSVTGLPISIDQLVKVLISIIHVTWPLPVKCLDTHG